MNGDISSSQTSSSSRGSSPDSQDYVSGGAFLPLALVTISVILVFIWQLSNLSKQRTTLRAAQEQYEAAFRNTVPQLDNQLQQSRAVQAKLEALVTDVLALARDGDADAQAIKDKYKIEQQGTPGAATVAPSPAASR